MEAGAVLSVCAELGLTVTADGDAINVRPRERLTDELRSEIRQHKIELLVLLPRYRWQVVSPDGSEFEVCCLPETTAAEMAVLYRGATLIPLRNSPDWQVLPMVVETWRRQPVTFDRSRRFGIVRGHRVARYAQEGVLFDVDGQPLVPGALLRDADADPPTTDTGEEM